MASLDAEKLAALWRGAGELAVLDVREARWAHGDHLTLARHAPLSQLELQVGALVPRRTTPVVVYDADDVPGGPADRAQALLARLGYTDVRRLEGGLAAWVAHGFQVVDGYNALVKAFGDLVRRHYATPVLSLDELEARRRDRLPTTLVDVRPAPEFAFLTIDGARNHAGTELALRDFSATQGKDHLYALNCFSRTRGIIGTTTLRLLGSTDRAVFVEDGVMAWTLRGGPVVQNARPPEELPALPEATLRRRADELVARHGLARITPVELERLRGEAGRSLYLFDVRPATPAKVDPAVRHVPGGQLLMHFENLVGTRGARVVLLDDPHGLRAAITAFWLAQLNQAEVFILDGVPWPAAVAPRDAPRNDPPTGDALDAAELAGLLAAGEADVVDVGPSLDYERGHLPGALFLLPVSLDPAAALLSSGRPVVFTSPDGAAARLAARDARLRLPPGRIGWLRGGTQAWSAAGRALETEHRAGQLLTPFDDDGGAVMRVFGPRREAAWRRYLAWERKVGERVAEDPLVRFRFFDAPPA